MLNPLKPVIIYFKGVVEESKKITFPTRQDTTKNSIAVIISVVVGMAILALVDFVTISMLEKIIK
ncbi:preprotein translocase subunit SecE [Candidatus Berkelbacteria bacterium CG_4_9_14_3_um_filter_39_23]|uniref:Protein translocase subunit SecE n=1 Tax=Candidatus Berkelbacteria bacterium CG_4_9_14_3_um_filter_39_23 TaxID=1974508 RepID=A0A2M8C6H1_9BACT|nr:preprotein translocase subunit SecE [Candidatus Berkelbacteria bacterium]OIP05874.1 MAG: preprotein translocase subunit SecE [Candidatus Berkelbacteria bacterium CG2_30_39_44]PIR27850.1 MAG: preprotein translocase subunit SecE [Candidatus Berkelbacteria bacterium CG11_big_fil_rev_8_21_14_0_20_40_23]PIX30441.1 MAG: preprotein translocase subunit SecE [Candidatus Berkelbacteria bacterium CG_4_8_14_3_um_filter_39_27]PJB51918.1 MAG: preprotein translocase subunit SecE [Candidatus Berkelbacteria 